MFNKLKSKIASCSFYTRAKWCDSFHTNSDIEEIYYYYNDNALNIAIKDEEIGKNILPIIKRLKDNNEEIISTSGNIIFKIKKYVVDAQNIVKFLYIDIKKGLRYLDYGSKTEKLQEIVAIIEGMKNKGYVLDCSKFEKEKYNSISAFLSFFIQEDERSSDIQESIVEYIHYVLSKGTRLDEFYGQTLNNVFCKPSDFPYSIPIIKMCYDYFVTGNISYNIDEVLEEVNNTEYMEGLRYSFYVWDLIVNRELLDSSFKLSKETNEYKIYDGNIKIYNNISCELEKFLRCNSQKLRDNFGQEKIIERVTELIIDYNNKFIGYKFSDHYDANVFDELNILKKSFKNQRQILDFILMMTKFLDEIRILYSFDDIKTDNDFCIEKSVIINYNSLKIISIDDLFNIASTDIKIVKKQVLTLFFKLYLKYLNEKYGELLDEEQIFSKIEVRCLSPILAREFINYALNKVVDFDIAADDFHEFILHIAHSSDYAYDSRFIYNPLKTSYFLNYEFEKKYGIKIKSRMDEILPDGRRLVTFRKTNISKIANTAESSKQQILKKIGDIFDEHVKLAEISEIIYSDNLDSNNMYQVVGYILNPVKCRELNDEFLLSLSNKDFLKVAGYLFTKFDRSGYYIDLNSIWMDDNFVFYINIFDKDFKIKKYSNEEYFVHWIANDLLSKNCNPNTFINIDFVDRCFNKAFALELADHLDAYCEEHGIYYDSKFDICPICSHTKYFIPKRVMKNAVFLFEDMYAKHYKIDEKYNLKLYKKSFSHITEIEKNIDYIIGRRLCREYIDLHQKCFLPYKKAITKNGQFVGYIYEAIDFDSDWCIDLNSCLKMKNLPRVLSLIRLMLQVDELKHENLGFIHNPFSHVFLSKNHKKQVQIMNVEFLRYNTNFEDTEKWTFEYVSKILASDESIKIDIANCHNNLDYLLGELQSLSHEMTKYCSIHNMYYRKNYSCCPKCCDKEQMEQAKIEEVDLSKIINQKDIGEGGESIIYPYKKSAAKIFKEEKVDYNFKSIVIFRILSKKDILEEINNQGNSYQYIYPKTLLIDQESQNICGYTMEKIDGKPISILRDKVEVEKLGFTVKDILEILITVGKGIETLHTKANIYIGDLNGGNILFDSQKHIYFVDFDGMGIDDIAPVFCTEGYIDPNSKNNHNITMKDDWYSFAIQAFYYLTFAHPFDGIYVTKKMDVEERMENKLSLLGNHGIKPPTITRSWDWMNEELKTAFLNIFEGDSRKSIVKELSLQYKELYSGNFDPTVDKYIRINPKFIAKEINFGNKQIERVINQYAVICQGDINYYLTIRLKNSIQDLYIVPKLVKLKNVLLSEDERIAFCIYENEVLIFDIIGNHQIYEIRDFAGKDIVLNNNTLYFSGKENGEYYIWERKLSYDVSNGAISNFTVKKDEIKFLPKQKTKKFLVRFNSKFVIVKEAEYGKDDIYCNTEKICDINVSSKNSKYNIIYDEITKWWLIINSDGNGVVIRPNGTYIKCNINRIINTDNIGNINFNKGKILVPCQDYLYIVKVSDQSIKKMECNKIMTPNSKIYDINTYGYSVITDTMLYEVRKV